MASGGHPAGQDGPDGLTQTRTPPRRTHTPTSSVTFTLSLDGFNDPHLSGPGSVPESVPPTDSHLTSPTEESYPVFSPPPYPIAMEGFQLDNGYSPTFYAGVAAPRGYHGPLPGVPVAGPSGRNRPHRSTPSSHHACNLGSRVKSSHAPFLQGAPG